MANARRAGDLPEPAGEAREGRLRPVTPRPSPAKGEAPAPAIPPRPGGANTRGFRTVLRNRYFLRLWAAQLISQTIMNAANYGLLIVIATRSNTSYLASSFAIVAFALPAAVFGAPAGVLVDRFPRRPVLWISNLARAGLASVFAIALLIDRHALLPAYAISFCIALIGQFFAPAEGASIPLLVHPEELINALSLFNITFTIAQALGLIILGPILLLVLPRIPIGTASHGIVLEPIETLFIVVAVLYIVCAGLILSIPKRRLLVRKPAQARHRQVSETRQLHSIWTSIVECWHFIRLDRRLLVSVLQLTIGGTTIAVVAMVAPGFVETFFHTTADHAILVFLPAGVGLVLGSAFTPNIVRRLRYTMTIAVGITVLAVSIVLLTILKPIAMAVSPAHWFVSPPYLVAAIFLTFCIGVALDFVNVPAQTVMQERSPDWIKGRVLAVQGMLLNAVTVPFVPLMGIAFDRLGILPAMDILALCIGVTGATSVVAGIRARTRSPLPPA
ncbi:MAG: MFS transporter [Ktedonobacterales bacterium]